MPFTKPEANTGADNHSTADRKGETKGSSSQKIYNSGQKASASQKFLIQKFRQQTEELKEIKKTISTISHSRLINMQRLKVEKLPEEQSVNLYTLSQPSAKQSIFKVNKSKRVVSNLNFNNNQSVPVEKEEGEAAVKDDMFLKSEENLLEESGKQKMGKDQNVDLEKSFKEQIKQLKRNQTIPAHEVSPYPVVNEYVNNLPLNTVSKKRSMSANNLKSIQNLAIIYKKQKYYGTESNQVSLVSSGFNSPMEMKHRFQERIKESRARIMSSKVKIIEGQTNFKLEKKIKENLELVEKQKTLHELIHTRMQRERQKAQQLRRRNEERRLVHESRKMKVGIQRASKKQHEAKERQFHRSKSEETLLNVMYNRYAKEMDDIKKQQLLAYKLQFLKNLESVQFRPVTRGNNPEANELSVLYE